VQLFLALASFLVSQLEPIRLPAIAWARKTEIFVPSACETHLGGNSKWHLGAGAGPPFHVESFITKSIYKWDFLGPCLLSRGTGQTNPPASNCLSKKNRYFVHSACETHSGGNTRLAEPYHTKVYLTQTNLHHPLPYLTSHFRN